MEVIVLAKISSDCVVSDEIMFKREHPGRKCDLTSSSSVS